MMSRSVAASPAPLPLSGGSNVHSSLQPASRSHSGPPVASSQSVSPSPASVTSSSSSSSSLRIIQDTEGLHDDATLMLQP